mmetsp:Transcript_20472/g.47995  ORF Transcript_20472/g.47995 Transcript_20472/m.47995 type:complete len:414 (-) Transcript_20472:426-1667(-)
MAGSARVPRRACIGVLLCFATMEPAAFAAGRVLPWADPETVMARASSLATAAGTRAACAHWRIPAAVTDFNLTLNTPHTRTTRGERLPAEAAYAIHRLACAATKGQTLFSPPGLSCPDDGKRYGYELALALQFVRLVPKPVQCDLVVVVKLLPRKIPGGNTPGANLLQLMRVLRAVRAVQFALRKSASAMLLENFRFGVFHVGQVFAEVLFGLSMHRPCADEIERLCAPSTREGKTTATIALADAADRNWRRSGALGVRTGEVNLVHSTPKANTSEISDSLDVLFAPTDPTYTFLRMQYALMRKLVPLRLSSWMTSGANIVIHVRGGGGTRAFHESLYLPLLGAVKAALTQRGVRFRVHVYHEVTRSLLCCEGFERQQQLHDGDLHVHTDPNRYAILLAAVARGCTPQSGGRG